MSGYRLGAMEARFAELIWENEPVSSGELVRLCEKALEWKKSTTYTMLRRLCERGIFKNEGGAVTSRLSRDELCALQSEQFVEDAFGGSLPALLAAFTRQRRLSEGEIDEIQAMINAQRGGRGR